MIPYSILSRVLQFLRFMLFTTRVKVVNIAVSNKLEFHLGILLWKYTDILLLMAQKQLCFFYPNVNEAPDFPILKWFVAKIKWLFHFQVRRAAQLTNLFALCKASAKESCLELETCPQHRPASKAAVPLKGVFGSPFMLGLPNASTLIAAQASMSLAMNVSQEKAAAPMSQQQLIHLSQPQHLKVLKFVVTNFYT